MYIFANNAFAFRKVCVKVYASTTFQVRVFDQKTTRFQKIEKLSIFQKPSLKGSKSIIVDYWLNLKNHWFFKIAPSGAKKEEDVM